MSAAAALNAKAAAYAAAFSQKPDRISARSSDAAQARIEASSGSGLRLRRRAPCIRARQARSPDTKYLRSGILKTIFRIIRLIEFVLWIVFMIPSSSGLFLPEPRFRPFLCPSSISYQDGW